MTTSIQAVSEVGRAAMINPLHMWGSLSQVAQAQVLSHVYPSSVTALGANSAAAPLAYDATDLLQTFPPIISAAGLNAAQQDDLTAALGLNAYVPSADTLDTNNALLMPTGTTQALVSVLVSDANAATAKANSANPELYNEQGIIEGVPGDGVSQARDAATRALLNLGASGVAASTDNPANTPTGGVTANQFIAGTEVAANNTPTESLNFTTTEKVAMAEYAAVMATSAGSATVAAGVVMEAAPAVENMPAANLNFTTVGKAAMAEYAAVMAISTPAVRTETATTSGVGEAAVTTAAITVAPATTAAMPAVGAVTIATATQVPQGLSAANGTQLPGNLPTVEKNVVTVQAATAAATAPVATELGTTAKIAIPPAPAPVVANTVFAATAPTTHTIPVIRFDNASSVLQSLIVEAAAHALIQRNPASATYAMGGAMFQMGTGADHVQQYTMQDYQPDILDIPDIIRPVAPIAGIRGSTERQA
ncbi:MAG: hypothetical protein Q7S46_12920 [Gallionella sp.]|nr:hypothetical protein [Gallionella sp.]